MLTFWRPDPWSVPPSDRWRDGESPGWSVPVQWCDLEGLSAQVPMGAISIATALQPHCNRVDWPLTGRAVGGHRCGSGTVGSAKDLLVPTRALGGIWGRYASHRAHAAPAVAL